MRKRQKNDKFTVKLHFKNDNKKVSNVILFF